MQGGKQGSNRFIPYRPLNPGEYRSNPDGSRSTEITMTETVGSGFDRRFMNFPSLYMTGDGIMQVENPNTARNMALNYELGTGRGFPRFSTLTGALDAAQQRTRSGGAMSGFLAR